MDIKRIKHIISQGEGISVEFKKVKSELPQNLFETVCAFLNRNGGEIVLGISDYKEVAGVDENRTEELCRQIVNLSNNPQKLFPSFLLEPHILDFGGKKLIYVFVPISSQVHKTSGKIYDRGTDGDFELKTDEQIKQLYQRKSGEYSENRIYPYLKETDFAPGIVERARKMIRINRPGHPWNELTNEEFFKISGLYRHDFRTGERGFTLSAILLFGKHEVIQSAVPHYKIDALVRKENPDRYDDRDNIRCNLIEAYDRLMNFVAKHLPDKFYLEGTQRISLRDKIFREVIANLLIHREYINAYPSTFVIYSGKVVSKNANRPHHYGKLMPNNYEPFPKNPDIARIFTQIGHSEELGTGIRNVYRYTKEYSNKESIVFKEDDIFITEIPLHKESEQKPDTVNDTANDTVNERQKELLHLISVNNKITMSELSKKLKVARLTVIRDISKLKDLGLVERIGPDKTGYWEIRKK